MYICQKVKQYITVGTVKNSNYINYIYIYNYCIYIYKYSREREREIYGHLKLFKYSRKKF